jgi:hypothetical protein
MRSLPLPNIVGSKLNQNNERAYGWPRPAHLLAIGIADRLKLNDNAEHVYCKISQIALSNSQRYENQTDHIAERVSMGTISPKMDDMISPHGV